jgi:hypothetical protein
VQIDGSSADILDENVTIEPMIGDPSGGIAHIRNIAYAYRRKN